MRGFGSCYRQSGTRFWWIQYWHQGKRRRESSNSEKQSVAMELLKRRLGELASSGQTVENAANPQIQQICGKGGLLTMGDLYEALERDYVINRRKDLVNLKSRWAAHLKPIFAERPADQVTVDSFAVYVAGRQGEKASNGTINRELATLKRAYRLAVKAGKILHVPYIQMLKERNVRKGFVKDAQYAALAESTARCGLWLRAMFELGYSYGWRKGELLELRVRQVDLAERHITLNAGETKNDDARFVVMTQKVWELLSECCAGKQGEDHVFSRERDRQGRRPKLDRISDFRIDWRAATAEAGCPGLLFHDLRRTGVRNMRRDGISEKVAMTISGHKTRSVFERYNIVDPTDLKEAAARMEKSARERRHAERFEQVAIDFDKQDRKPPVGAEGATLGRKVN